MSVPVPQSTIEKPLTVIDFIAAMDQARSLAELAEYANALPANIVEDERFARAFRNRLDTIREKRTFYA